MFTAPVVFIISSSLSATPVQPVRTMDVPPAIPALTIDGIADDVYSEVQTTHIFNSTGLEGDADFSASFQLCWDPWYLYVYAEITDDVNESYSWEVGNAWEFDNIELFLQLDTNTVTTSYSPTTVQLRICRGLDSVETPGHAKRSDFIYYMEGAAAGGWICEVAIPWTAVLGSGSDPEDIWEYECGKAIGFDFSGADSDNTDGNPAVGNRDVQSAWDDDDPNDENDRTEDGAWNNTSVFGYVGLYTIDCQWEIGDPETEQMNQTCIAYPNPSGDWISFENITRPATIVIYDMRGVVIYSAGYYAGTELDISSLQSGLYMAVIDGKESVRFIKE